MSMTIPFEDVGSEYYRDTYWLYKGLIYKCGNAYSEAYLYGADSWMGSGETILELDGFEHPVSAKDCAQISLAALVQKIIEISRKDSAQKDNDACVHGEF